MNKDDKKIAMGVFIKNRRKELKITQDELAKLTGYSDRSSIAKIEKGIVDLNQSKIIDFSKALNVTPTQIINAETSGVLDNKNFIYEKLIPIEIVEIPMDGKASAGNGYINFEQEIGSYTVPKNIYKKGIFAIRVSGDSMTGIDKSIPDGSTAVVDPELCTDPINLNNKVCVFEYNDETYIKQLIIDKQGIIRLRSFNPEYDDIIVLNEKLLLCKGRVIRTFVENQW